MERTTINRRPCKACQAPLIFAPTADGKSIPLDGRAPVYRLADGVASRAQEHWVSHFATCPEASRFGKAKKPAPTRLAPQGDDETRLQALMEAAAAVCPACAGANTHRRIPTQRIGNGRFVHDPTLDGAAPRACDAGPVWGMIQAEGLLEVSQ